MKLNTNSNIYTIVYASVLVVIVAFLLAFVYQSLKDKQDANVKLDTKKQILYSLNIRGLADEEAEARYDEVVKEEKEINGKQLYICEIDGQPKYVLTLKGMGLWGGISGFLSVRRPFTVPTSTTKARQPDSVPRLRTRKSGKKNSKESNFLQKMVQ